MKMTTNLHLMFLKQLINTGHLETSQAHSSVQIILCETLLVP